MAEVKLIVSPQNSNQLMVAESAIVLPVHLLSTYLYYSSDKSFTDNAHQFKGIELKWQSLI